MRVCVCERETERERERERVRVLYHSACACAFRCACISSVLAVGALLLIHFTRVRSEIAFIDVFVPQSLQKTAP